MNAPASLAAPETPRLADFTSVAPYRVRYHEVDLQNIVFNAHYLTFADVGITEYFRTLSLAKGGDGKAAGNPFGPDHDMMVRHASVDYRASARVDDLLGLAVRARRFGGSSFLVETGIFRDEELLVLVHVTYVHFAKATGRPARIPDGFRAEVAAFEKVRPEGL